MHPVEVSSTLDEFPGILFEILPDDIVDFGSELRVVPNIGVERDHDRLLDLHTIFSERCGVSADLNEMCVVNGFAGLEVDEGLRALGKTGLRVGIVSRGGAIQVELTGVPLAVVSDELFPDSRKPHIEGWDDFMPHRLCKVHIFVHFVGYFIDLREREGKGGYP
jgi:hypothetical protein